MGYKLRNGLYIEKWVQSLLNTPPEPLLNTPPETLTPSPHCVSFTRALIEYPTRDPYSKSSTQVLNPSPHCVSFTRDPHTETLTMEPWYGGLLSVYIGIEKWVIN